MSEYRDAVKRMDVGESGSEAKEKLAEDFEKLSNLIKEYEERIHLTANNIVDPTKEELEYLKKLFGKIEDMDFATSEKYEELTGRTQA